MSDDYWTRITDANGTRMVKVKPRKRRASPRAIRFADLQAGQCLIHRGKTHWETMPKAPADIPTPANEDWKRHEQTYVGMAIVEHRWFDPVAGEKNRWAGEMAGIRDVGNNGRRGDLAAKTLRGLAQAGYHLATPEQAALIIEFADDRDRMTAEWKAGRLDPKEALAQAKSLLTLMREMGLEEEYRAMTTRGGR